MQIEGLRHEILAYAQTDYEGEEEGYVVCFVPESHHPYVCWKIGFPLNSDPIMWWGHYFHSAEEALNDFAERVGLVSSNVR